MKGKVLFKSTDGDTEEGEDPATYFEEGGQGDTDILEINIQTAALEERIGAAEANMETDEDSEPPDFPAVDDAEMEGGGGGEEKEGEDHVPSSNEQTDDDSTESVTPDSEREKQDEPSPPGPNAKAERLAKDLAHLRALKTPGAGADQPKAAH